MALINCPECNTQVSSAAPSCPKCGFPIAQHAEPAEGAKPKPDLTEARVEKPKKPTWRRMASLVPPALLGLVVIYVLVVLTLNRCHEDRSEATATHAPRPTETREAQRETQEAQRCDEYKRGIKAAMPDLFNGEVVREIDCEGEHISTTIKGVASRQPRAERVLSATVTRLVKLGLNPRRDEVNLSLYIYQTGKTVTGADGARPMTSATYWHLSDSVEDGTADWLKMWDRLTP